MSPVFSAARVTVRSCSNLEVISQGGPCGLAIQNRTVSADAVAGNAT